MNANPSRVLFSNSVPTFLVVRGIVQVSMNGFRRGYVAGEFVSWRKHGFFRFEYIGDDYAVVHHETLSGKVKKIFIPERKRMFASNGRFEFCDVNYQSFLNFPDLPRGFGENGKHLPVVAGLIS